MSNDYNSSLPGSNNKVLSRYEHTLDLDEKTFMLLPVPFPVKLFYILNLTTQSSELSKVVSWDDAGLSFAIHDLIQFQDLILLKYFRRKYCFNY